MEYGNFHALPQRALDVETFRGLDVLKVDPPEGRLQARHDLDQFVRVALVDLDVEHVDAGKFLEQTGLSLHYRLAGQRPDIAQTEYGGAVGDDRHQVGARGQRRRLVRIIPDGKAGIGNAGRIGERQVALIYQALGRRDGDFSERRNAMIFQRVAAQLLFHHVLPLPGTSGRPRRYFLLVGGRSVHTPSNTSAAMPIDSHKVGCGWIVLPMSTGSQPISTARQTSPIRSPAWVPTMPPPSSRWFASSNSSLVKPSSRPLAMARPDAAHGNTALPYLMPLRLALLLGHAGPGDLRIGVSDRRDLARLEDAVLAGRGFRRHVRLVHCLVRQHRLADDVADREDVRHVGAHLLVDRDKAAVAHRDARLLGIDLLAVRTAPHRHQHHVVELRLGRRLLAFEV